MASEIAYSTYMYASCQKNAYQKVTSYTRIALQAGRLLSSSLSQLLISCNILNFHELNYLSLAGLSLSLVDLLYFHEFILEYPISLSIYCVSTLRIIFFCCFWMFVTISEEKSLFPPGFTGKR